MVHIKTQRQHRSQGGHHQKQPSRIKTSSERDPSKSEEEGRFRLGFWDATSGERKEKVPRDVGLEGAGAGDGKAGDQRRATGRKEEKLGGTEREGKGELQGGYYPGRKRREGRGETDSDGGGTRGAWESWLLQAGPTPRAHPTEALLKMAALLPLPLPPPPELGSLPSVSPGGCEPGAATHQAEEEVRTFSRLLELHRGGKATVEGENRKREVMPSKRSRKT
ncbi:uncharacterized protein LOC113955101 [Corapipo altera]|uniref:uncharacterized protein LOC113955101 n=1 Tax=Corapipo altera TaxID=415028 RepID=UPI000FD69CCE|nr:uncharacterized protein LOC113955101 [Corapipo altera]